MSLISPPPLSALKFLTDPVLLLFITTGELLHKVKCNYDSGPTVT